MTLTHEDVDALRFPFADHEHSFEGGYLHVKEFYICARLDDCDPAWNWDVVSITQRPIVGTKDQLQVTVHGRLTLHGVTRDGVGMALALPTKPRKDQASGEITTQEANEAEKAATTDALIRAARLFGVGRYLLVWRKRIKTPEQLTLAIENAKRNNGTYAGVEA